MAVVASLLLAACGGSPIKADGAGADVFGRSDASDAVATDTATDPVDATTDPTDGPSGLVDAVSDLADAPTDLADTPVLADALLDLVEAPPDVADAPVDLADTSSDPADAAVAMAVIGPQGGILSVGGVTVTIPPGALAGERLLGLSVSSGPTVSVEPDTEFLLPVRVDIASRLWPYGDPTAVLREVGGGWYHVAELESQAGNLYYYATGFTKNVLQRYTDPVCWRKVWVFSNHFPKGPASSWTGARDIGKVVAIRNEALAVVGPVTPGPTTTGCLVDVRKLNTALAFADPYDKAKGSCTTDKECAAGTYCRSDDPDSGVCPSGVAGTCQDGMCVFKRSPLEPYLMSVEAANALAEAERKVEATLPGHRIWINGAMDSTGRLHGANSYHYYGAAVDLALCKEPCGTDRKTTDSNLLGQLPPLLLRSGFSWVWYEGSGNQWHIHASITSPACGVTGGAARPGVLSCSAPQEDCNCAASDACEINLERDQLNCGACDRACGPNQLCRVGICIRCGDQGEPCCPNGVCSEGTCQNEICASPCGAAGEPCCGGSECNADLLCESGVCSACGARNQTCCEGNRCSLDYVCRNGVCRSDCGAPNVYNSECNSPTQPSTCCADPALWCSLNRMMSYGCCSPIPLAGPWGCPSGSTRLSVTGGAQVVCVAVGTGGSADPAQGAHCVPPLCLSAGGCP